MVALALRSIHCDEQSLYPEGAQALVGRRQHLCVISNAVSRYRAVIRMLKLCVWMEGISWDIS